MGLTKGCDPGILRPNLNPSCAFYRLYDLQQEPQIFSFRKLRVFHFPSHDIKSKRRKKTSEGDFIISPLKDLLGYNVLTKPRGDY